MKQLLCSMWVLALATLASAIASPASAQTIFVEGSAFASMHWRSTTPGFDGPGGAREDRNGTVAGGGFAIGTWLTPRVSLRLETGWPAEFEGSYENELIIMPAVNLPPITLPGITLPGRPSMGIDRLPYPGFRVTTTYTERSRSFAPLLAFHTSRRHGVQLGYVGGAAFLWQQSSITRDTDSPVAQRMGGLAGMIVPNPRLVEDTVTRTHYTVVPMVGLDADIAVAGRLSIVPQVRALAVSGGLNLRPAVAVRLTW